MMFNSAFVTFPCGILSQMLCLSVPIPDLCHLSYFFRDSKFFLEICLYINDAVISQRTSLYALCEQLRRRSVRRFCRIKHYGIRLDRKFYQLLNGLRLALLAVLSTVFRNYYTKLFYIDVGLY